MCSITPAGIKDTQKQKKNRDATFCLGHSGLANIWEDTIQDGLFLRLQFTSSRLAWLAPL